MEIEKYSQNFQKCKENCLHHSNYRGLRKEKCPYKIITSKRNILRRGLEIRCTDFTNYKKEKKLSFFDVLAYFG